MLATNGSVAQVYVRVNVRNNGYPEAMTRISAETPWPRQKTDWTTR